MSMLSTTLRRFGTTRPSNTICIRLLSTTTARSLQKPIRGTPPPPNHPPSAHANGRTQAVSDDPQSSASTHNGSEKKSGDDHPAKQPDPQQESDRSTGFNEVKGGVKGGKEGLDQRTDRQ